MKAGDVRIGCSKTRSLRETYFSLMGTTMYLFLKMSTFDVHLRTLGYAASTLNQSQSPRKGPIASADARLPVRAEHLVEERVEDVDLVSEFGVAFAEVVQPQSTWTVNGTHIVTSHEHALEPELDQRIVEVLAGV